MSGTLLESLVRVLLVAADGIIDRLCRLYLLLEVWSEERKVEFLLVVGMSAMSVTVGARSTRGNARRQAGLRSPRWRTNRLKCLAMSNCCSCACTAANRW